jgi:hypothetical protein
MIFLSKSKILNLHYQQKCKVDQKTPYKIGYSGAAGVKLKKTCIYQFCAFYGEL